MSGDVRVELLAFTHDPRITRRQKLREGLEVEWVAFNQTFLVIASLPAQSGWVRCLLDKLVNQAFHDVLAGHPVRFGDVAQHHGRPDVQVQRQCGEQIVFAVGALAAFR